MPKVSVCCCSINSKWDAEIFIRALHRHNPDFDFEVVLTHDNRVDDGSAEHFTNLQKEFPNFKVVEHTEQNTIDYFTQAIEHYKKISLNKELVNTMEDSLDKYKAGELIDKTKFFVWQSSGILYNKAVEASTGDVIVVSPADFIYMFSLRDVYQFVRQRGQYFYGAPTAIWAKINNQPHSFLVDYVKKMHTGELKHSPFQYGSPDLFRDYLRCPPKLSDLNLPDFKNNRIVPLDNEFFIQETAPFVQQSLKENKVQHIDYFHGFHVMTRAMFNKIGGFTEEWIHRAFADDKMSFCGERMFGRGRLPPTFSIAWIGQYEVAPTRCGGYIGDNWMDILKEVDPLYNQHPIAGSS